MSQILLVNKDPGTMNILTRILRTEGYKVVTASDVSIARNLLRDNEFNLMICDADKGGEQNKLALLKDASAAHPNMPIIVIMEQGELELRKDVDVIRTFSKLEKPLKVDKLLTAVQKAVDYDASLRENVNLNLHLESCYQFENIVADSSAMKSVCDMVSRVAATDISILLLGEKGVGKTTIAKAIHLNSRRKDAPMVIVECESAEIGKNLMGGNGEKSAIERASSGTLLLQNVEKLPVEYQGKLLSMLQENKTSSVRLIATSTENLDALVARGIFNADFYRLVKVITIKVLPLRERKEDILPLFRKFLREKIGENKALPVLAADVLAALTSYKWPNNAVEMLDVVNYVAANMKEEKIVVESLPPKLTQPSL